MKQNNLPDEMWVKIPLINRSMKITEIFDSNLDLQWQQNGRFELTSFTVGNMEYSIQIEAKPLPSIPELKNKRTAEVSFFTKDTDISKAFSTQYEFGNSAIKVYGVVLNAIANKFKDYDAFYFIAKPEHSSNTEELKTKSGIYLTLANKVATSNNIRVYDQKTKYGNAFLVSKFPIENNDDFINETLEYLKNIDWGDVPHL